MTKERVILHSDLNGFYASVEIMLNPKLRGYPMAVCGSTKDRHGIVLAKSEEAKKYGIKTGMVNWEAKKLCPKLLTVPPQFFEYLKYSRLTKEIYDRFTDKVEPFGMDECWLDVTDCQGLFGSGEDIAQQIRQTVKNELGLTVSIGVSFNKIFAKLGSDMKKPDAVTVITRENYKEKVWTLPAEDLFYVGRATKAKLARYGIFTIGDLANTPISFLRSLLGKNGEVLYVYANGLDNSRVMPLGYEAPVKSLGHGTTTTSDMHTLDEVSNVILHLVQDLGHRLREHELMAGGVQITVKDNELSYKQFQKQLLVPTQSPREVAEAAKELFVSNYRFEKPVRSITVRAISLTKKGSPAQLLLYDNIEKREKQQRLDDTIDQIRERFGDYSVIPASLLGNIKTPGDDVHEVIMPSMMYV